MTTLSNSSKKLARLFQKSILPRKFLTLPRLLFESIRRFWEFREGFVARLDF